MKLTFWGTRGSIPVPGPATLRYGGNTPCLALESAGETLVLDAGSGIRGLGIDLAERTPQGPVAVLLSHAHADHIQGLPFFAPLHNPAQDVPIYGPPQERQPLRETLARLMIPPVWPAAYEPLAARLNVTEITAPNLKIGTFHIRSIRLRHPGVTYGYSIRSGQNGGAVNYLTDNELALWPREEWQNELVGFLRSGDVLIHDATYGEAEIGSKAGWGHSSAVEATDLAIASGTRKLVLFHHAPEHADGAVEQLVQEARSRMAEKHASLEVVAAHEGLVVYTQGGDT